MPSVLQYMPQLEGDEMNFVQGLIKDMTETQAQQFTNVYINRRKDPQNIMLFSLIGLLGVAGIQRFVLNQAGMGILYFLTGGLCLIGTILDIINAKRLAFDFNYKVAQEVAIAVRAQ